jgi:hypothetical protein
VWKRRNKSLAFQCTAHRSGRYYDIETKTEEMREGRGMASCAGGGVRRGKTAPFNTPVTIKVIKSKNCFYFRSFL